MVTKEQIKDFVKEYPDLYYGGFLDTTQKYSPEELVELKEKLIDQCDTVNFIIENLQTVAHTKKINNKRTSYGLKHVFEKTSPTGYISNGTFILAALLNGFNIEKVGINARFNMSDPSLQSLYPKLVGRKYYPD